MSVNELDNTCLKRKVLPAPRDTFHVRQRQLPPAPPRPLANVTCARAQWTPQPAALPTSPLSPSFAMPPPRRLTMRNAGRAVELVLFSLPLQRSGCAQHGNPAATPVCAHRNSPPFPDLTRRATPARTFMTHASYAATHVDSHLSVVVSRCCPAEGMGGENKGRRQRRLRSGAAAVARDGSRRCAVRAEN